MKKVLLFLVIGLLDCSTLLPTTISVTSVSNQKYIIPQKYTINLMWINRKLNENQQYIYPASNENELSKLFLRHIFKWALVNKNSTVHLWFDSMLTPAAAVKNTHLLIKNYLQAHPDVAPIILRDVRELPYVMANPEVFSDKTPIFFRVDLLRVIAQVHDITTGVTPYFVYSDLDIDPLSREEIFDEETLHKLQTFGIVMAYHPIWQGFENSFSIVSNHNAQLLEAMTYTLIDLNIQRAYNALHGKFYKDWHMPEAISLVELARNNQHNNNITAQQLPTIPHNYSINIIWINERFTESQQYIHSGLNDEELLENFFKPIFEWAAMNSEGTVNIWFDSAVTPSIAVKNTSQFLHTTHPELSNIILRDIRKLPFVQNHSDIFSSRTPVHFQKQLLEVIAAMFDISMGCASYCLYGDLFALVAYKDLFGLKTLSAHELFDEQAMKGLQKFGMTSTNRGGLVKEIIGGNTTGIVEILTRDWLNPNIKKAYSKLSGTDCYDTCCAASMSILQQIIYLSYASMFKYFYHRAGLGKLFIENHEYDKNKDGLVPFGLDRMRMGGYFAASKQLPEAGIAQVWMPTKKIAHPQPTLIYEDEAPVRSMEKW